MKFKFLYPWGIDFSNFPALRTYFNDNLFNDFFVVALVCAVVSAVFFYFFISTFRAYLAALKVWIITGLVGAIVAGLITFFYRWSAIAKAYTAAIGKSEVTNAITEGRIKYAITNVVITFVLYFVISLIISPLRSNVRTIPINWKQLLKK